MAWPGAVCRHHRCPSPRVLIMSYYSTRVTDRDMGTLPGSLHHALNSTHWAIHSESFRQTRRPRRVTWDTPSTRACGNDTAESGLGTTLNVPPTILISAKIAVTLLNSQMMQCSALAERIHRQAVSLSPFMPTIRTQHCLALRSSKALDHVASELYRRHTTS